jgi:hypothetical protein
MPRRCSVCRAAAREAIDDALLNGEPYRRIAQRFAASPDAVNRHKAHVSVRLAKAQEAAEIASADSLAAKLLAIEAEARRLGEKAENAGDLRAALQAVRELIRLCELTARLSGELRGEHVVVAVSAEVATRMAEVFLARRERQAIEIP